MRDRSRDLPDADREHGDRTAVHTLDRKRNRVARFLSEVFSALGAGQFALAADVREERVTPLDRRVEALGGVIFRAPKIPDAERRARESAARRAELEQLEIEHAGAEEERKPKLRRRLEALRANRRRTMTVMIGRNLASCGRLLLREERIDGLQVDGDCRQVGAAQVPQAVIDRLGHGTGGLCSAVCQGI